MEDSRLLRDMLDSMNEPVYVRDREKNLLFMNRAAERLTGWSCEEGRGMRCYEIFGDEGARCRQDCPVDRVIARGMPLRYHNGIIRIRDGSDRNVTVSIAPLVREGAIAGGVVFLTETVDSEGNERELLNSLLRNEERMRLALEFTQDGLFDWNMVTGEVYYSPGWKKLLGYGEGDIPNDFEEWRKLTHPEDVVKVLTLIDEVLKGDRDRFEAEFRMKHRDGHWVDILARADILLDGKGQGVRMVGTHIDITERKRMEEELIASRRSLEEAQEIARLGSWTWYVGEDHTYCSPEYFRLFGQPYDRNGFTEKYFYTLVHPDDRQRVRDSMDRALKEGSAYEETYRIVLPDGRERVHHARGEVKFDEGGKPLMVVGIQHDITEMYRIEEALRESEERYRNIINSYPDGFLRTDMAGRILESNPAYRRMTGYSEGELLGMSVADVERIDSRADVDERIGLLRSEGYLRFETEHRKKDGTVLELDVIIQYREREREVVSFLKDAGERRKQERALKFQALMLDQIEDQIIATDLEGRVIYANGAECAALNRGREEVMGMKINELRRDPIRGVDGEDIVRHTLERGEWQGEVIRTEGGRESVLSFRSKMIRNEAGEPLSLLGIATDITERKRIAERLRQSQKLEAIGSLAGGIAHDFNNILTPIMGMADLLLQELPPDSREVSRVRDILAASERGAELVRQILAFGRKSPHRNSEIDLADLIGEVCQLFRATIPQGIRLHLDMGPCARVKGDASQLNQVIMNLLTNALHAMEKREGEILIRLREEGARALVEFTDRGMGMAPEVIEKIFEPYYTTKGLGKGTGLGLSVVYGIIKEHGGDITVESEVEKGTTFRISLPVIP